MLTNILKNKTKSKLHQENLFKWETSRQNPILLKFEEPAIKDYEISDQLSPREIKETFLPPIFKTQNLIPLRSKAKMSLNDHLNERQHQRLSVMKMKKLIYPKDSSHEKQNAGVRALTDSRQNMKQGQSTLYHNFVNKKKNKKVNHMAKIIQKVLSEDIQPWNLQISKLSPNIGQFMKFNKNNHELQLEDFSWQKYVLADSNSVIYPKLLFCIKSVAIQPSIQIKNACQELIFNFCRSIRIRSKGLYDQVLISSSQNQMNAIQVSSQEIKFVYNSKGHLQSILTIRNNNQSHAYFKFKVTRPKYYLIKPDHGFCDGKTSINISITLHQQGVNQGQNDKVKLYFKFLGKEHIEPTKGWQKQQPQASSIRFPVTIEGLPQEYKRSNDKVKISEVRSVANSKFSQPRNSALESSIHQKENRVNHLKSEIDLLKKGAGKLQKTSQGIKQYLLVAVAGLVIGFSVSFWL